MKAMVHSIESFGTVDGPGTRFVIFLKGCPLRCKYCHNPDTWEKNHGEMMTVDEILEKYEGVKEFITGGITVSGGEPLMQMEFLTEFFKECKNRKIHTCIDTSGITFNAINQSKVKRFEELFKYVDLVLLDIKHIDPIEHEKLTGLPQKHVLEFAEFLDRVNVDTWIRHVVVPEITLNDKYLFQLGQYIATLKNIVGIEILPYHTMAVPKYEQMNLTYPLEGVRACTEQEAIRARQIVLLGRQNAK